MKVALIGDIHANLPALGAVLNDARKQKVQAIWNLGDFVGYGPYPEQVVQRIHHEQILSIIGNYDLKVLDFPQKKEKWRKKKAPKKYLAFRWAYENISESSRTYLRSLAQEQRLEIHDQRILLTHGSPASNEEHLYPDTPQSRFLELAELANADVVACAHSHVPFTVETNGVTFVNPGSLGRPQGNDPGASYALLEFDHDKLTVCHRRIEYDVHHYARIIQALGLPDEFAQMILQGKNLDEVLMADDDRGMTPAPSCQRTEDCRILEEVLELARSYQYEEEHAHQVARVSLALFDELKSLHQLGEEERFLLLCGALLHDVGWIEGRKQHHKTALKIILETPQLSFTKRQRLLVGLIARYHRKALPGKNHDEFNALKKKDQKCLLYLAAMMRVADGLDRSHLSLVHDLKCKVDAQEMVISCDVAGPAYPERWAAQKKAELLSQAFDRNINIKLTQGILRKARSFRNSVYRRPPGKICEYE